MSRVYIIRNKADGSVAAMVNALSKAAALRYMAEQQFDIKSASQNELIAAMRANVQLQEASEKTVTE
jgi:hypothetical protein